jgi:DNA (cytosine-5)-methyltransferase 1
LPLGEGEEIAVSGLSDPYGSDAVCSGQMRPCVSVRPGGSLKTASNSCRICEAVSYPLCAGWAEFNSPAISAKEGYAPWRADPFGLLWTDEPDVGRVADGVPSRVDRVEALGNAVVPQQAFPLFAAIAAIETGAIA